MICYKNKLKQLLVSLFLLLNTTGGIKNGQTCYFEADSDSLNTISQEAVLVKNGCIYCSNDATLHAVDSIVGEVYVAKVSATGTPPHLQFSNYVGAYYPEQQHKMMPGAARRYIFFEGKPVTR